MPPYQRDRPDHQKSRKQLLTELEATRARLAEFEAAFASTAPGARNFGDLGDLCDRPEQSARSGLSPIVRLPVSRRDATQAEMYADWGDEHGKAYQLARWREDFTRAITESLGEGVYAVDHNGHMMFMNPAARNLLGYSLPELMGRPAHEKISYLRPDGTRIAADDSPIAHVLRTQETYHSGDEVFVRKDGTLLPVTYIATPFESDGKPTGAVVTFHDIGERQRTDRRRALDLAISRVLAEVNDLEEGAPRLLQALAGSIGWESAGLWLPTAATHRLECAALWCAPGTDIAPVLSFEWERSFGPGEKLPGIVWTTGTPQWIGDLLLEPRETRRDAAIAAGVRSVLGFPVRDSTGGVLGVVVCGDKQPRSVDEDLLAVLLAAGERIGVFMERAAAERARRASESRMRATLEIALDGIVVMDADNRIVEFNAAAERTFGYRREEVIGQIVTEKLIPPSLRTDHLEHVTRYLATGTLSVLGERVVITAVRADGSVFPAEIAVCQIPHAEPPMFTMYLRDITDRVRLENEVAQLLVMERRAHMDADLRASELDAIFNALAEGVIVYDAEGSVRHLNPAGRALLALDALPEYFTLPPDDRPWRLHLRDEAGIELKPDQWPNRRLLNGETLTGANVVYVLNRILNGDDREFNYSGAPLWTPDRRVDGAVMIFRDVTEQRKLERRTRDVLRAVLEMAETLVLPPDAVRATAGAPDTPPAGSWPILGESPIMSRLAHLLRTLFDCDVAGVGILEHQTQLMRPLAVSGRTPELERRWWSDMQHSPMDEAIAEKELLAVQAGDPVVQRFGDSGVADPLRFDSHTRAIAPMIIGGTLFGGITIRHSGPPREYSQDELALLRAGAKLATVIAERERLLREREEARTSEGILRESNRRMDEFLSIASHELKTPMTSILLSLHLLQSQLRTLEPLNPASPNVRKALQTSRKILKRADQQGARMNRLVGDLLDVSRIRMNRFDLRLHVCDMLTILREVTREQALLHPLRKVSLTLPPDDEIAVTADAVRIGQVITNYLTNALKYTPEDQPIAVSLRREGHVVRVTVRDFGPGLKPIELMAIWDRFHRAEGIPVVNGSEVGLGLGLYISRTIIERHGGQVGVESSVGKGSSFWFTLPLTYPPVE